ncbi:MAG: hypothetical protein ACFCVD_25445 [Nodosilinea sp.]
MELSLLLAIALLVGLFFWLRRYSRQRRGGTRPLSAAPASSSRRSVNGSTQRQLLRLVGGNRDVAERLVEQVQLRNPNHSEQWCWEKAIYDIQRDRHSQ